MGAKTVHEVEYKYEVGPAFSAPAWDRLAG
ncbi:hypothetical protein, partial [Frankia sp. ACN1ag]